MKTVTTIEQLLPLVADARTCDSLAELVVQHMAKSGIREITAIALAARDALNFRWSDAAVKHFILIAFEKRLILSGKDFTPTTKEAAKFLRSLPAKARPKPKQARPKSKDAKNDHLKSVTTLEGAIPLLAGVKTVEDVGRIIVLNVPSQPRGLRQRIAFAAKNHFAWQWKDRSIKNMLRPTYHTPQDKAKRLTFSQKAYKQLASTPEGRAYASRKSMEYVQNNIHAKIAKNCRIRVLTALKGPNGRVRKSAGTEALIGCTVHELMNHLASQFRPGMSWDNHGEWHIDHIRPCASFDLTDPVQQRACFHFTNLQPLWAADNLAKADRLDWAAE